MFKYSPCNNSTIEKLALAGKWKYTGLIFCLLRQFHKTVQKKLAFLNLQPAISYNLTEKTCISKLEFGNVLWKDCI